MEKERKNEKEKARESGKRRKRDRQG